MYESNPTFSIIIPVYNRPEEVNELLTSLDSQTKKDFEVIIIEDGSSITCEKELTHYASRLNIRYFVKENGGPSSARNFGAKKSHAKYLLFLDSDCITPPKYIEEIESELNNNPKDLFGGSDRAHASFTPLQKAIDYSMTSPLTTGGIRGNKKSADKFYPRTFNMGVLKEAFEKVGGFANMRFGEDVDFSYRVIENGFSSGYYPNAWVYHKRRSTFKSFFKQVYNSGIARIHLSKRHPGTLKLVHLLPSAFVIGSILLLAASIFYPVFLSPLAILFVALFSDASIRTRSIKIGLLSMIASIIQLTGYGTGLISGWWNICILKKKDYAAFVKNFYK